eukprot:CAMPEP_0168226626 /NCGR_PEP_ID=MMETSP0140_2-20121125/13522_1 /TAXON_ID=44445 /ORGANISM="Pseudo-nitzschia australis, Strain 10249 10 AB" /LENGTH=91 /DNA_ID=CAMNT_0008157743 /DNA_START=486 /DNA_END=757 /DNA_ORIENTATION=+
MNPHLGEGEGNKPTNPYKGLGEGELYQQICARDREGRDKSTNLYKGTKWELYLQIHTRSQEGRGTIPTNLYKGPEEEWKGEQAHLSGREQT